VLSGTDDKAAVRRTVRRLVQTFRHDCTHL
jgi:hypothetical protein